jgi:hypothetical protein
VFPHLNGSTRTFWTDQLNRVSIDSSRLSDTDLIYSAFNMCFN